MIAVDTATLLLLRDPGARPPQDPNTGALVSRCRERAEYLLATLSTRGERVLLPTPVLAEYLVKAGANRQALADELVRSRNFVIGDFDVLAAIELSLLRDPDLESGRALDQVLTKAKIKFDRQVVAIAKVQQAHTLYTDDDKLGKVALANGLLVVRTWELDLPPEPGQGSLRLDEPSPPGAEEPW